MSILAYLPLPLLQHLLSDVAPDGLERSHKFFRRKIYRLAFPQAAHRSCSSRTPSKIPRLLNTKSPTAPFLLLLLLRASPARVSLSRILIRLDLAGESVGRHRSTTNLPPAMTTNMSKSNSGAHVAALSICVPNVIAECSLMYWLLFVAKVIDVSFNTR